MGDKAVQVGMADLISDYETTIKTLSELTKNKGENSMDAKKGITKDQIAAYRAEGAKAERERLLALEEVAVAGHENLLAKAKANPKMTAEKLALEIVKAEKAKAEGSEYEFDHDAHQYGVDSWRNVGYGYWQHACQVTLTKTGS